MARIWANRLEARDQRWADCPDSRKAQVRPILLQDVADGRITAEQYREITGEMYKEVKKK